MKPNDRNLLDDLIPSSHRDTTLRRGTKALQRRRFIRRASQSAAVASIALVAFVLATHKPIPAPAPVIASPGTTKPASLTDSQLMALFPGVPKALMTVNGQKRLVFLRTADAVRYVGRAAPGGA